jgi:hypothetical protein
VTLIGHLLLLGFILSVSFGTVGALVWFLVLKPLMRGSLRTEIHRMTPAGPCPDGDAWVCRSCGRVTVVTRNPVTERLIQPGNKAAWHDRPGLAADPQGGVLRALGVSWPPV